MKNSFKGKSLDRIYELRSKFCLIGLTGRTGSGVTEFAKRLTGDFDSLDLPQLSKLEHNNGRKYKICHDYLNNNWRPFKIIYYKDVITFLILIHPFEELITFLEEWIFESEDFTKINGQIITNTKFKSNKIEIDELNKIKIDFEEQYVNLFTIWSRREDMEGQIDLWNFFSSEKFNELSKKLHNALEANCCSKRIKILQTIANSYRRCGMPYCNSPDENSENVFEIAKVINYLIKGCRKESKDESARIVIDSIRNPMEIMFFKERYSAFYMIAINRDENERSLKLDSKYSKEACDLIKQIDLEEYVTGRGQFNRQDVSNCIQKSDVHINYNEQNVNDSDTSQSKIFNSVNAQILKIFSLIYHPGLITPSPEERCMQIAFTAKYNSGCISRQVGAVVTDQFYSIKAVGWNNTAENQVPCLLRNADDLILGKDENAFSKYEKTETFKSTLKEFQSKIDTSHLGGHNCSFCFKDFQNYIEKEKNQVHTRSLHAEENAFLQIVKYGGEPLKDGLLFTTASPCELCSKKAYQLGIRRIYYIDPYPGIAKDQILSGGTLNPELELFVGAIGRAYHKLYEPFMYYKDELLILTGLKLDIDKKRVETINKKLRDENIKLRKQIAELTKK